MKKTRQQTEVAKTLSGGDTQKDTVAKRLFSINEIIAWILKLCMVEFSANDVQDIVNEWLAKADKWIGTEPVLPDVPPRRSAVGTEDKSKTDGTVYFDFRMEIPLPNAPRTAPLLVIDMELQNEYKKRLALHKRSVYYNCRLISSQPGRLTGGKVIYSRLCRAYSIWIYPNAPKRLANHVRQTWLTEKNVVGTAPLSDSEIEANRLMGIWKIYIRDGIPPQRDQKLLWLFYVLFTRRMTCDEKMKILVKDFDMKATEEVEKMCTFEEQLQNEGKRKWIALGKKEGRIEGREEGRIEGREEGRIEGREEGEIIGEKRGIELGEDRANLRAYTNMKQTYDDDTICSMLGISMQKLLHLKELFSNGIDLQPKTV